MSNHQTTVQKYLVHRGALRKDATQKSAVQIVCADAHLASEYRVELDRAGEPRASAVAASPADAHAAFARAEPLVTLLDESAVPATASLEAAVALLAEAAPVVVVAGVERRWELAFLITSGAADFVPRSGSFVALAAARIERRIHLASAPPEMPPISADEFAADFGEILRHELNNQLTGVLGNAELLLGRRERLPPDAVERLETVAQLAVRLRETVRRLSHAWDLWQRQTQQAPAAVPAAPVPIPLAQSAARPVPLERNFTSPSRSSDGRRPATGLASVPRMPLPRLVPAPRSPETSRDAADARWDRTWRNRKE